MGRYLTRRLLTLIPAWIGVTLLAFLFVHSIPGGPFDTGAVRPARNDALLEAHYHLDRPLPLQYVLYMRSVLTGDLGESIVQPGLRVSTILTQRFPTSAELGSAALSSLRSASGFPLGLIAAVRRNRSLDRLVMVGATIGYAIPNFILSILFILILGLHFHLSPAGRLGAPIASRSAGPRARASLGELHRPADTRLGHRDAAAGLHPHSAREGRRRSNRDRRAPRVPERADADHDRHARC